MIHPLQVHRYWDREVESAARKCAL
jgi:hypothetical protein